MRIQYSYRLVEKEFHEPWRMSVEKAVEPALKPLIEKRSEDSVPLQIVLERAKKGSRLTASGHMHLPGKKIVSVTASHNDLTPLAHMLAQALFRQAKKHFDRLSAQDQIKRKARRERLRELKARIDTQPASVVQQARGIIETLLPKVEAVAQRELAYLHAAGDLPRDYPTLHDVVDEAIALAESVWTSVPEENAAYLDLLKHLFAVIDREVANSRQYGEAVSLDAPVEADAQDMAEAMVEEEFYEFYQPDDALSLADVMADSRLPDPAAIAEQEEIGDRSSEFAFAFDLMKGMPHLWRRIFLLIRVDGLDAGCAAEILRMPNKIDAVRAGLIQAEAFIAAHVEDAGVSEDGNDWIKGVNWSAMSVIRSEATSPQSKQANHEK